MILLSFLVRLLMICVNLKSFKSLLLILGQIRDSRMFRVDSLSVCNQIF